MNIRLKRKLFLFTLLAKNANILSTFLPAEHYKKMSDSKPETGYTFTFYQIWISGKKIAWKVRSISKIWRWVLCSVVSRKREKVKWRCFVCKYYVKWKGMNIKWWISKRKGKRNSDDSRRALQTEQERMFLGGRKAEPFFPLTSLYPFMYVLNKTFLCHV